MLIQKLHVKPGIRFIVVNAPKGFDRTLGKPPGGAKQAKELRGDLNLVVVFALDKKTLKGLWPKAMACLRQDGVLWVAYPKKSSGIDSDLASMGSDWEVYKNSAWQPVSSIAVDETWSGVRFKYSPGLDKRRADREEEVARDNDGTACIDRKTRVITPPNDLRQLLDRNPDARVFVDALSFTDQKEYVAWIIGAKRPETRAQRRTQTLEKLLARKKNPSEK